MTEVRDPHTLGSRVASITPSLIALATMNFASSAESRPSFLAISCGDMREYDNPMDLIAVLMTLWRKRRIRVNTTKKY
nr:unnamed protein product [Callosobruchus chinensis]